MESRLLASKPLPDPAFRLNLKQALLIEHARQQENRFFFSDLKDEHWSWQMAATVPVVVGLLAFLWRRHQRSPS